MLIDKLHNGNKLFLLPESDFRNFRQRFPNRRNFVRLNFDKIIKSKKIHLTKEVKCEIFLDREKSVEVTKNHRNDGMNRC